jgi:hypothetical protein
VSYDLFFTLPETSPDCAAAAFLEHFADRPNYQRSDVQAWYANEDTGVYFVLERRSRNTRPVPGSGPAGQSPVATGPHHDRLGLAYEIPVSVTSRTSSATRRVSSSAASAFPRTSEMKASSVSSFRLISTL